MDENIKVSVSREFSVDVPAKVPAYFIEHSDWHRVSKMVKRITPRSNWFQISGSVFSGAAIASFISVTQSDNPSGHFRIVTWDAVVVCGVLGAALFALDRFQSRDIQESCEAVLEEMEDIETRVRPARPVAPKPTAENAGQ